MRTWMRIGLLSFGGPAGQIALLYRILVEEKRWLDERRFLHALQFCMLLPGPEAHQLVVYTGRILHGIRGGILAGTLFVLPGLFAILTLSVVYVLLGTLPLLQAALLGLRAAVIAIVLEAWLRMCRRMLDAPAMVASAALAFFTLFAFRIPFPVIVLGAGLLGWLGPGRFPVAGPRGATAPSEPGRIGPDRTSRLLGIGLPLWLGPFLLSAFLLGSEHVFTAIARLGSELALLGFGGAYAVLSYATQVAVESRGWLAPSEMLDGLALAETVPGPLVLVLSFVGFLAAFRAPGAFDPVLAGILGGALAAWAMFLPSFLLVLVGAPYIERLRTHTALSGALGAIAAAAVGAIALLVLRFALYGLFLAVETTRIGPLVLEVPVLASWNPTACLLALLALLAAVRFRPGPGPLLLGGAASGVLLHLLRFELLGFL